MKDWLLNYLTSEQLTSLAERITASVAADNQSGSIDLSGWQITPESSVPPLFQKVKVHQLILDGWGTNGLQSLANWFSGAQIDQLAMNDWNLPTQGLTNLFEAATIGTLNAQRWWFSAKPYEDDALTETHQSLSGLFQNAQIKTPLDLSSWRTANVVDLSELFQNFKGAPTVNLNGWDVTHVHDFDAAFKSADFQTLDLSTWDFAGAQSTQEMLQTPGLNQFSVNESLRFKGTNDEASYLNTPPVTIDYPGYWQNQATGAIYTAAQLANLYMHDQGISATYRWLSNQTALQVTDLTLHVGAHYDPHQLVSQLVGPLGDPLTPTQTGLEFEGAVDSRQAGQYPVTVSYQDRYGKRVTATATVRVIANDSQAILAGRNMTVVAGPRVTLAQVADLLDARDDQGRVISLTDALEQQRQSVGALTVKLTNELGETLPTLDLAHAGHYFLAFSYLTNNYDLLTHTSELTLLATRAAVHVAPVTVIQYHVPTVDWQTGVQLVDANGQTVNEPLKVLAVDWLNGPVDPKHAGRSQLTLTYTDLAGNVVTGQAWMTVVASQAQLAVKVPAPIVVGTLNNFDPTTVFDWAVDEAGQLIPATQVHFTDNVDPNRVGQYAVRVRYSGPYGTELAQTVSVQVVAAPAPVDPKPGNPAPVTPEPVNPEPGNPAPVTPAPVDPEPGNPAPVTPEPVNPKPVKPVPDMAKPIEPQPNCPQLVVSKSNNQKQQSASRQADSWPNLVTEVKGVGQPERPVSTGDSQRLPQTGELSSKGKPAGVILLALMSFLVLVTGRRPRN
ncbi:BspA family leucine-rich repeat surface protein [Lactiplantibacillus plajomi]|uniref:BspA family leucine-rich repeat surface protein n=1 Tax=Lactiplantibacillus plajomi TaxID=1457217 RepID=A0ABV6K532_9LACO|nr:BspA family leucine-rich repeat surface protein [Lactiplantibacillus plajomi]